ncbi:CHASE domain-containing protein [Roseomonas sp. GC11]|uniref:CHASE domain-containing protein n=1 Tax=Roseomonas sp. GC11 TaxID=2950546 RepID=UPI00210A71A8|nr:CHASE domain-containing protein [Roseomonas sp. GC11]MCQ4158986.1 CHASE domain-containing protein [Roseomonas sp. GC11]
MLRHAPQSHGASLASGSLGKAARLLRGEAKALSARVILLRRVARIVLALGVVGTLVLWHMTAQRALHETEERFQEAGRHVQRLVEERLLRSLDLIAGFRALFEVSDHVTRQDFHRHAQSLRLTERFPGVLAVQFAPYVPAPEKERFEAQVRADISLDPHGYSDYAIHPAGERPFYLPVLYNEPMAGNEAAFGHDNAAEPTRLRVMERSRDTGEPMASPPLELVQGEIGFVVRQAIFRRGVPTWTVEQRRAAFIGQISGVFRASEVLKPLLRDHLQEYRIRLYDRGPQGGTITATGNLMYDSRAESQMREPESVARLERPFSVAGRNWAVVMTRPLITPYVEPLPLAVLLAGVSLTLAMLWVIYGLVAHYRNAVDIAERLLHQAQHDALTGLPNRLALEHRLEDGLQAARQAGGALVLLFLDLNRFKVINDSLGHDAGDAVLQAVGLRLRNALRPGDTIARLGGDEFVILLTGAKILERWQAIAARMIELIEQPIEYKGEILSVGASMGAAFYPRDGGDAETLLHHADGMMYAAKRGQRDTQPATPAAPTPAPVSSRA